MDLLTANDQHGEYPQSWYTATADAPGPYAPATGQVNCDVCVIGGGFTGLSAALHLAERGYDVVLLEAQRVGFGASGRNGGQVGTGQRLEQEELESMVGRDDARKLWDISLESVQLVRDIVANYAPDAGFTDGILHAMHRARYVPEDHDYVRKLNDDYDYDLIRTVDRDEMRVLCNSPVYHGGSLDMGGGHTHPLRLAFGMARAAVAKGARIHETSRVNSVVGGDSVKITTELAEISAKHLVWACNGYLGRAEGSVAARVMPINNFIVATEPLGEDFAQSLIGGQHAVADSKFVVNYFRLSEDNRMLFGGAESYGYRFPKDIRKIVSKPMLEIYPQLKDVKLDYAWGGTLGITMNRMPHFARLAGNVLSASGYSGHGVAMATLGGKMAAEAIAGQAEKFDLMASVPTPRFPGGVAMRWPLLVAAMLWYAMRDKL